MHQRRGRLLLVDGDMQRGERLAQRLAHHGFDITLADNGASALLKAHEIRPEVIISAAGLPILNGYLMLQALRSDPHTNDTTVILITEGHGPEELARGWSAGADLCVPRAQGEADVLATLHRALSSAMVRDPNSRELSYVA